MKSFKTIRRAVRHNDIVTWKTRTDVERGAKFDFEVDVHDIPFGSKTVFRQIANAVVRTRAGTSQHYIEFNRNMRQNEIIRIQVTRDTPQESNCLTYFMRAPDADPGIVRCGGFEQLVEVKPHGYSMFGLNAGVSVHVNDIGKRYFADSIDKQSVVLPTDSVHVARGCIDDIPPEMRSYAVRMEDGMYCYPNQAEQKPVLFAMNGLPIYELERAKKTAGVILNLVDFNTLPACEVMWVNPNPAATEMLLVYGPDYFPAESKETDVLVERVPPKRFRFTSANSVHRPVIQPCYYTDKRAEVRPYMDYVFDDGIPTVREKRYHPCARVGTITAARFVANVEFVVSKFGITLVPCKPTIDVDRKMKKKFLAVVRKENEWVPVCGTNESTAGACIVFTVEGPARGVGLFWEAMEHWLTHDFNQSTLPPISCDKPVPEKRPLEVDESAPHKRLCVERIEDNELDEWCASVASPVVCSELGNLDWLVTGVPAPEY